MTWMQEQNPDVPLPPEPWLPVYHVHGLAPCNGLVAQIHGYKFPGETVLMSEIRRIDGEPFVPGDPLLCLGCGHVMRATELGYV